MAKGFLDNSVSTKSIQDKLGPEISRLFTMANKANKFDNPLDQFKSMLTLSVEQQLQLKRIKTMSIDPIKGLKAGMTNKQ
jgi:hypothetical protein